MSLNKETKPNQFYFKQFSLVLVHSLYAKTVLFQAVQFRISSLFEYQNSSISINSV